MEFNISVENVSEFVRKINIGIPAGLIKEREQKRLQEVTRNVRIKGFRPGKAPVTYVSKVYGDTIKNEVVQGLIGDACDSAFNDLNVIGVPTVDFKNEDENGDLLICATVNLYPEYAIKDYIGIPADIEVFDVTDQTVDSYIESLCMRYGTDEEITDRNDVQRGDIIIYDAKLHEEAASVEGESSGNDYTVKNKRKFIAAASETDADKATDKLSAVEEGFVGARVGEVKQISCEGNSVDNPCKQLETTDLCIYDVCVKRILKCVPCELTDEFLIKLGVETMEELRSLIRTHMEQVRENSRKSQIAEQVVERVMENNQFDITEAMLDVEIRHELSRCGVIKSTSSNHEYWHFDISKYLSDSEFVAYAKKEARRMLILNGIVKQEQIVASESDIADWYVQRARETGRSLPEILKESKFSASELNNLKHMIARRKVVDFLIEKANVTERVIEGRHD